MCKIFPGNFIFPVLAYLTVPWPLAIKILQNLCSIVDINLLIWIPIEKSSRKSVLNNDVVTRMLYYSAGVLCESMSNSWQIAKL